METYTNIYQQRPSLIIGTSIEVATRAASVAPCGARAWRRRCSGCCSGRAPWAGRRPGPRCCDAWLKWKASKRWKVGRNSWNAPPPHLRQFFFGLLYFSKYAKAAKAKVGLGTWFLGIRSLFWWGNLELQVGRVWRHFTLKAWDFVYLQRLDCIMYVVL